MLAGGCKQRAKHGARSIELIWQLFTHACVSPQLQSGWKKYEKRRPLKLLGVGDVGSLRRHPFVVMNRFYLDLSSDIRLMPSLFCWHKDHKDSAQEKKKKKTCVDVEAEAKARRYDSDIFAHATAAAAV